jgi:hypothetical protein
MLDGIPLEGGDYLDEIVWGFEQMYRFLCHVSRFY